ncbi:hypothetical protein FGG08_005460 [Glutinoglossum americanum]|uniref:Elongation factor 1-gamma n=1 Tax=Glutinoglossum americanum TaxID=1670608 RepID=A0A9P8I0A8_9PEZI|nr:hypothetical protein FGG08_005460 [Glutinoglossum americanum]
MSFGKLYTRLDNPRSTAIRAVAKENKLDLEIVEIAPNTTSREYLEINPLGKIPSFKASDGYILTECIAIAIYKRKDYLAWKNQTRVHSTTLPSMLPHLLTSNSSYASILKWMSFSNHEVVPQLGGWTRPLIGLEPYNKKSVETHQQAALKAIGVLEKHLLSYTFLVGERITLADIFSAGTLYRGFQNVFDKEWRKAYPNVTRWYETVHNQPIYAAVAGTPKYIDEAVKYTPPKKEPAPKAPKAAPKPKAKETEDDGDEEDKPAPKPKHPLEALPKATLVLDDWKRKYSNEETRTVALPWFWENYKPEEYSLWRVDYKYNDELTQIFMTSNLIGGFFARLEASRKYIFGAASVYGQANDSVVVGAFLIRGQDALPAFDVAPDYESYEFTKLDPTKKENKEFVDDQWSWDKPMVVKGKAYPWADGKVFK